MAKLLKKIKRRGAKVGRLYNLAGDKRKADEATAKLQKSFKKELKRARRNLDDHVIKEDLE